MKKIIATDFDGTLTIDGIPPRVVEAIERFRAAGNLFGVVTGRDKSGSYGRFIAEKKFPFDFVLALNGAQAYDAKGNKLYDSPIRGDVSYGDTTLAKAIVHRIWELSGGHCGVAFEDERLDLHPDYPNGGKFMWVDVGPIGDPERDVFAKMKEFSQLNTVCESEQKAAEVTVQLKKEFGDYVNPLQNGICIDIPVRGMDKGVGIARYAEMVGVEKSNIWTAGDNYNDLAMIEPYHGCAMASGVDAVKKAAEFVCRDISEVVALAMRD